MSDRTCDQSVTDRIEHWIELPPMCPVSGNPASGSIAVTYTPTRGRVVDVDGLAAHVAEYVGGRGDVREMERAIQSIAEWCASEARTRVVVVADLEIRTVPESRQRMRIRCERRP